MLPILRPKTKSALSLVLTVVTFGTPLYGKKSPLWGDLEPGPYCVGFKVVFTYDYSRTWKPKYDATGRMQSGTRARPIRISTWYPAKEYVRAARIFYKNYVYLDKTNGSFSELNDMLERRNVDSLRRLFKEEETFNSLMLTEMNAVLNAEAQSGTFPLIVYSSGLNESWQHANAVLCEYLASHGYIVAAVPQVGTSSVRLELGINPVDLETQVRDMEYAVGVMHDFPKLAHHKLAVMGHSMGAVAGLILQMRNPDVDVVIGLDAAYWFKPLVQTLTKSPYYRPERMLVPFLDLHRQHEDFDSSGIDGFKYSDRYFLELPGVAHADFTSFPMIAVRFPVNIEGRTRETASRAYETVCRYVLNFLDAYLKGDEKALRFMRNKPEGNGIPRGVMKYEFHARPQPLQQQ